MPDFRCTGQDNGGGGATALGPWQLAWTEEPVIRPVIQFAAL